MLDHRIFNERNESQDRIIEQLKKMHYDYVSRSESDRKRGSFSKVIYEDELAKFLAGQTYKYRGVEYHFSGESVSKAIKALDASLVQGLTMASKEIYNYLCNGISVTESIAIDGDTLGEQSFDLNYIDWEHPEKNIWQTTEEFSVEGANGRYSRPDIVLFCNGIPFCVIECKSASISIEEGVNQNVRNMMPDRIPQLFKYTQLVIAANPAVVKYGTTGTSAKYFIEWREQDIEWQNKVLKECIDSPTYIEQDRAIVSLLEQERVLDIMGNFILYHYNVKKIARYQQFFAVNNAMKRILGKDNSDSKNGVIWHTQGSGKSLTMVMLVKKIQKCADINNPRFLIVTDRISLDKQIKENFASAAMAPVRATTGKGLKKLLENKKYIVITTLINKFEYALKSKSALIDSDNFFVLVDEAHRSQYKSMHNYMRELLPRAIYIGFTGTPLVVKQSKNKKLNSTSNSKKDTRDQFGEFIDTYTMKRAIEDKITVPLVYEGRKVVQNDPSKQIDYYFDSMTKDLGEDQRKDLKQKYSRFKYLAETDARLNLIAWDVSEHFITYCIPKGLKAMLVCSSRASAVYMFNILSKIDAINPAVIISYGVKDENEDLSDNSEDKKRIEEYKKREIEPNYGANVELYESTMIERFKSEDGDINMLIVKDKLLTGFDAPIAGVLYVDKPMQQHNLLQAIARVNRVYEGKDVGLIVDYYGLFAKLHEAIDIYDDLESGFDAFDKTDLDGVIFGPVDEKNELGKAHEELNVLFDGVKNKNDFNEWQEYLSDIDDQHNERRKEFYNLFKKFGKKLDLAFANRAIFVAVGFDKLEKYKQSYRFFNKLKNEVAKRYNDVGDFKQYEEKVKGLLNTFVHCEGVAEMVKPFNVTNKKEREDHLAGVDAKAKADMIRTRILSELNQKRYDDPLKFEKFSELIKKTLLQYQMDRDADAYLNEMERIADDAGEGRSSTDYPNSIKNNSDAKAFYGTVVANLKTVDKSILDANEELIADLALKINDIVKNASKRDWHFDNAVHKEIRSALDVALFDLFASLGIDVNVDANIDMLDALEDELMKVAIRRY